jgi:hypothetical protein
VRLSICPVDSDDSDDVFYDAPGEDAAGNIIEWRDWFTEEAQAEAGVADFPAAGLRHAAASRSPMQFCANNMREEVWR